MLKDQVSHPYKAGKVTVWQFLTRRSQICADGDEDCDSNDSEKLPTLRRARTGEADTHLPHYIARQWRHLALPHSEEAGTPGTASTDLARQVFIYFGRRVEAGLLYMCNERSRTRRSKFVRQWVNLLLIALRHRKLGVEFGLWRNLGLS